ncbi:S-adenosyl-L-methionine-dependent methyltransferase [Endogone sp. FLAS-F59071]|nr:S-adenosyl-L-methionine-dependent methyltransferase [Endogone sp. FLAS-F59071]|eukprot:RUS20218.1 S-adenosyl-L-methionine-dependent methyltransferase [Endogone sp. FLAS-F59071]
MPSKYLSFYKALQNWLPLAGLILAAVLSALWVMLINLPALLITQWRRHYFDALWSRLGHHSDAGLSAAKTNLLSQARGTILDVGAGHGHSFKYLPRAQITRVISLEPNELMHPKIAAAAASAGLSPSQVEISNVPIEQIFAHYSAGTIDIVYCNLVLCSVKDPKGAISNIYDLLKPGGKLMFLEHIRAEDAEGQEKQDWISQYWCWFFDGCRLNKPMDLWVREFKWTEVEIKPLDPEREKGTYFWHVAGVCTK